MPFQPGHDPNRCQGRRQGSRNVMTLKKAVATILPETDGRFTGTPAEFFASIYRDPTLPMDWRMAAAGALMRAAGSEAVEPRKIIQLVHVDTGLKRSHDDPRPDEDMAPPPGGQPNPVLGDSSLRGPFSDRPVSLPPPAAREPERPVRPERPRPPARDLEAEAAELVRLNNQSSIEHAVDLNEIGFRPWADD